VTTSCKGCWCMITNKFIFYFVGINNYLITNSDIILYLFAKHLELLRVLLLQWKFTEDDLLHIVVAAVHEVESFWDNKDICQGSKLFQYPKVCIWKYLHLIGVNTDLMMKEILWDDAVKIVLALYCRQTFQYL